MPAPIKHLLMILVLLTVGSAQVLGLNRGYLCDCTGEPVITERPSCDDHDPLPGHHHDDGCPPDDHQPHQKAVESLKSVSFSPLILSLPPSVEMDWPETVMLGLQLACERAEHRAELRPPPPDDSGGHAPPRLLVARTIVMLV